jgi:hypothetical protein
MRLRGARNRWSRLRSLASSRRERTPSRAQARFRSVREGMTKEALRQQRRHADAIDCDERACGDAIVTAHRTARQDGEGGLEAAIETTAAANGDGALSARRPGVQASAPYDQRASDSHDMTRLLRFEGAVDGSPPMRIYEPQSASIRFSTGASTQRNKAHRDQAAPIHR